MPIILRRPPSSFTRPIPDRDRNWGEHFPAYRADGRFALQAMCLPLGFALIFQILVQNWEIAAVLLALIDFTLLAAHYARRAESPHRFARILCAVYFSAVRSARTGRVLRRYARLPTMFFLGFLIFFAPRIRFPVGHDRPPLVDWRRLYQDTNWDYLRENGFFRDPPPSAPPPDTP